MNSKDAPIEEKNLIKIISQKVKEKYEKLYGEKIKELTEVLESEELRSKKLEKDIQDLHKRDEELQVKYKNQEKLLNENHARNVSRILDDHTKEKREILSDCEKKIFEMRQQISHVTEKKNKVTDTLEHHVTELTQKIAELQTSIKKKEDNFSESISALKKQHSLELNSLNSDFLSQFQKAKDNALRLLHDKEVEHAENIKKTIKEKDKELSLLREDLSQKLTDAQTTINAKSKTIEEKDKHIEEYSSKIKELERENSTLLSTREELLKSISNERESMKKEKETLFSQMQDLRNETLTAREENYKTREEFSKFKENSLNKMNTQKDNISALDLEKNKLLVTIMSKDERISIMTSTIEKLKESVLELTKGNSELQEKSKQREGELSASYDTEVKNVITKYEGLLKKLREDCEKLINDKNKDITILISENDAKYKALEKEMNDKLREKDEKCLALQGAYELKLTEVSQKLRENLDKVIEDRNVLKLDVEDGKRSVTSLNNRIKELEKGVEEKTKDITSLANIVKTKDTQILTLTANVDKVNLNVTKLTDTLKNKEEELGSLKKEKTSLLQDISKINAQFNENMSTSRKEKEDLERKINDISREKDRKMREYKANMEAIQESNQKLVGDITGKNELIDELERKLKKERN